MGIFQPASLWQTDLPEDLEQRLAEIFDADQGGEALPYIFFRADDIGRIDADFVRLMELFSVWNKPLCLALVPQWLTAESWQQMSLFAQKEELFCWHQHGLDHSNHESTAKKNEFGESRPIEEIRDSILAGKTRLEEIIGEYSLPVFTPPWNRCSEMTMQVLLDLDFLGISRSADVQPPAPFGLPDMAVNIDLHTRRETDPAEGMANLLSECQAALRTGSMGFMLHHQRMNENSFLFLEKLFKVIDGRIWLEPCTFREMLLARLVIG
jgi:hypothetical protein